MALVSLSPRLSLSRLVLRARVCARVRERDAGTQNTMSLCQFLMMEENEINSRMFVRTKKNNLIGQSKDAFAMSFSQYFKVHLFHLL